MQKFHVDEIIKKAEDGPMPGPADYERHHSFGRRQGDIACESRQYTMGKKIDKLK